MIEQLNLFQDDDLEERTICPIEKVQEILCELDFLGYKLGRPIDRRMMWDIFNKCKKEAEDSNDLAYAPIEDVIVKIYLRKIELKRGKWTEKIINTVIEHNLSSYKVLKIEGVSADVLFINQDKKDILFGEAKSSDELDVAKEDGEKNRYSEKIKEIRKKYPDYHITSFYYFRKKIKKNRKKIDPGIKDNITNYVLYGNELDEILQGNYTLYKEAEEAISKHEIITKYRNFLNEYVKTII